MPKSAHTPCPERVGRGLIPQPIVASASVLLLLKTILEEDFLEENEEGEADGGEIDDPLLERIDGGAGGRAQLAAAAETITRGKAKRADCVVGGRGVKGTVL
ncbi:Protein of unknown function [Gryllus bimaculatus]|nr:Protein of unknown function [Gryllus bimaculatus]